MSKSSLINIGLFLLAFLVVFFLVRADIAASFAEEKAPTAQAALITYDEQQRPCVRDASQVLVPVQAYQRIVSLSASVDGFLIAALGPGRIHGFSAGSKGKPYIPADIEKEYFALQASVETLLASEADLIIVPSLGGDLSLVNRLREAGMRVFHIGGMTGIDAFNQYCRQLSVLCKIDVAGLAVVADFNQRLDRITRHADPQKQKQVLYVSVFNGQIYGGTKGSSYHDLIHKAGLKDAATGADWEWSSPWPQLSIEQVLQLNPDYLLIPSGMRAALLGVPGLSALPAITADHIIEIDGVYLHDAGILMYEAAKQLHDAVYGAQP